MDLKYVSFVIFFLLEVAANGTTSSGQERFVTTKRSETYLRIGPDRKFPIEWVYLKAHYPFKVIAEFEDWYKVQDSEGTEGWVIKKSVSSARRWVYVIKDMSVLQKEATQDSRPLAYLKKGVLGRLDKCQKGWCRIEIKSPDHSFKGWVLGVDVWGLYAQEMQ